MVKQIFWEGVMIRNVIRGICAVVFTFGLVLCSNALAQSTAPACYPTINLPSGGGLSNSVIVAPNTDYVISAFCYSTSPTPTRYVWSVPTGADPGNVIQF